MRPFVKTVSVLTALLIATPAFARFADVSSNHVNAEAIAYVQSKGIITGYADGTYRAQAQINRAEFTAIIIRALWDTVEEKKFVEGCLHMPLSTERHASFIFSDVDYQTWYGKYLCTAHRQDIIRGYADRTFRPSQSITFAEAAKILVNGFGIAVSASHDPDGTPIPWYRPYVEDLETQKAIPMSIAASNAPITRGEMAEMIYRLHGNITTEPSRTYHDLEAAGSSSSQFSASADSQVYHNTRHGYSLTFPKNYAISIDEMTNDAVNASSISLIPNSVSVNVYTPGETLTNREDVHDEKMWQMFQKLEAATSKTITEFASVYAEYQQMSNTYMTFTMPERTELNGTASYRFRQSWTVDDRMGVRDYAEDCYVMENAQHEKIVLCQYSALPVGAGDVTVASAIAHSFALNK